MGPQRESLDSTLVHVKAGKVYELVLVAPVSVWVAIVCAVIAQGTTSTVNALVALIDEIGTVGVLSMLTSTLWFVVQKPAFTDSLLTF